MADFVRLADVLTAVRALGLTCRYQREFDEFRIDYKRSDPRWSEDSAYFTTYRDDAVATARQMAEQNRGQK